MENNSMDLDKDRLVAALTEELPSLRAKIGITQEELCDIVGISRQTYSSIETKKKKMSWNIYLSLIMFFLHNDKTAPTIEMIGAFPQQLREKFNKTNR